MWALRSRLFHGGVVAAALHARYDGRSGGPLLCAPKVEAASPQFTGPPLAPIRKHDSKFFIPGPELKKSIGIGGGYQ